MLPNGKIVLADGRNHGLVFCERSGRFQERVLLNEISCPSALCMTPEGHLAVACEKTIKVFTQKGGKLLQFKTPAVAGKHFSLA